MNIEYSRILFCLMIITMMSCLCFADANVDSPSQEVVAFISRSTHTYNEWETPGKYCPINLFDDDPNTLFAEESSSYILTTQITFDKQILIDEVRVFNRAPGLDDELNHVKMFYMSCYKKRNSVHEDMTFKIDNTNVEQQLHFGKVVLAESVVVGCNSLVSDSGYPGKNSSATAMSDVSFFYKGKRVKILNINIIRDEYIGNIAKNLKAIFSDRKYRIHDFQDYMFCKSDGSISYTFSSASSKERYKSEKRPNEWKVDEGRLYLNFEGVWELAQYTLGSNSRSCDNIYLVYKYKNENYSFDMNYVSGK